MALSSFQLFVSQVQNAPEELKVRVLQVIFDLLFVYNQEFLGRSEDVVRPYHCCNVESRSIHFQTKRIIDFLLQILDSDDSARTQAVLCVGFCKLLISGKILDPRVRPLSMSGSHRPYCRLIGLISSLANLCFAYNRH